MKTKSSKTNIYAIKYLFEQGLSVEQISEEISLSTDAVQKIIESENIKRIEAPVKTAKDLMINETSVKGIKSVAIMTKEASMMMDNKAQSFTKTQPDTHIFKPFSK